MRNLMPVPLLDVMRYPVEVSSWHFQTTCDIVAEKTKQADDKHKETHELRIYLLAWFTA